MLNRDQLQPRPQIRWHFSQFQFFAENLRHSDPFRIVTAQLRTIVPDKKRSCHGRPICACL
eukprot:12548-Eustigmatos_ZCMA.PRE.1